MKISQMKPKQQKKAIQQIAEKDQQMAKQVATMVKQASSDQGGGQQGGGQEGPQPSQARQQQRRDFNQEIPGFEKGGELPEYDQGGSPYDPPTFIGGGLDRIQPNEYRLNQEQYVPREANTIQKPIQTRSPELYQESNIDQRNTGRQQNAPDRANTIEKPIPTRDYHLRQERALGPDQRSSKAPQRNNVDKHGVMTSSMNKQSPGKAQTADNVPSGRRNYPLYQGDEKEAQFRNETYMMNSSYSQPDVLLEQMNPEEPDFAKGDGATKFSRKNGAYPGDIERIETDPYILNSKVQPEYAETTTNKKFNSEYSNSDSEKTTNKTTNNTSDGSTDGTGGGAEDDELSDSSLKKIGALSQIAPDIFGLAQQSGEPNYMPRTTNPRTEDALGTMDDAIDQMPDEYDIRDARMRNERAYHAGMDQMYRNSRSAAVARGNQANAYAQKMRGTNKLNVQKNNKEAQYAQAEAQLLSNKSQMEQQAGAREAQYSANYHRNKLKADAKQRAIRQKYLSNIGTKTAYNTRRELKSRRDMDKVRINQESHTEDVQIGMDKLIQLLEEDKKKDNSDG